MGRRKVELTPEQIEERKRRWWGEKRNARRRARYASDPTYRETAIQQVKEAYRRERIRAGELVREDNCAANLDRITELGRVRMWTANHGDGNGLTFTLSELARIIGRDQQVLYRWISEGMWPPPVAHALDDRKRVRRVYCEGEVRALIDVFSAHQFRSQYYRARHDETRRALWACVASVIASEGGSDPAVPEDEPEVA